MLNIWVPKVNCEKWLKIILISVQPCWLLPRRVALEWPQAFLRLGRCPLGDRHWWPKRLSACLKWLRSEVLTTPCRCPKKSGEFTVLLKYWAVDWYRNFFHSISEPRLGVPGQPGSLDFEVALGSITAQDVMLKRQLMGLADFDGKKHSNL